jgi:hypothetical protein
VWRWCLCVGVLEGPVGWVVGGALLVVCGVWLGGCGGGEGFEGVALAGAEFAGYGVGVGCAGAGAGLRVGCGGLCGGVVGLVGHGVMVVGWWCVWVGPAGGVCGGLRCGAM